MALVTIRISDTDDGKDLDMTSVPPFAGPASPKGIRGNSLAQLLGLYGFAKIKSGAKDTSPDAEGTLRVTGSRAGSDRKETVVTKEKGRRKKT